MKGDMRDRLNDYRLDFGDDSDVPLAEDPNFDAWVSSVAPSVNAPPVAPRNEMWDAIQAAQRTAAAASTGDVPGVLPLRRTRWILPATIAATLLLGVGIGRYALRGPVASEGSRTAAVDVMTPVTPPAPDLPARQESGSTLASRNPRHTNEPRHAAASASGADRPEPSRLYRLAAEQTLGQAEALLTAYKASTPTDHTDPNTRQLGSWGREVLSSTRLLIDSPAGRDPELRQLLNDLELVLVQIIQLSGTPLDASDRALIDRALRDRDLLPRIRTAVPAGVTGSASDE